MRIWIDTEFNGFNGELLSIALVAEDGTEFYEILMYSSATDPWVAEHVMPVMNKHTGLGLRKPISRCRVTRLLQHFLMQFESIHVIADWPEDIAHFCRLLLTEVPGERINTPPLMMEIVRFDAPSEVPHNALSDARGMREYDIKRGR